MRFHVVNNEYGDRDALDCNVTINTMASVIEYIQIMRFMVLQILKIVLFIFAPFAEPFFPKSKFK